MTSSTNNNTNSDSDNDDIMDEMSTVWVMNADTVDGVTGAPPKKLPDTHSVKEHMTVEGIVGGSDPLLYIAERLDTMNEQINTHIKELIHHAELEVLVLKGLCKRGRKRKRKVKAH